MYPIPVGIASPLLPTLTHTQTFSWVRSEWNKHFDKRTGTATTGRPFLGTAISDQTAFLRFMDQEDVRFCEVIFKKSISLNEAQGCEVSTE